MTELHCRNVCPRTGNLSPFDSILKVTENAHFYLENVKVQKKEPIVLQQLTKFLYVYLNNQCIVAVSIDKYVEICRILETYRLASVKVPNKQLLQLSAEYGDNECKVHIGTYQNQHECFVVVDFRQRNITIFDKNGQILVKNSIREIQFLDSKNALLIKDGVFYMWKDLQFLQIKMHILECQQKMMNEEVVPMLLENDEEVSEIMHLNVNKIQQKMEIQEEVKQKQIPTMQIIHEKPRKQILLNNFQNQNQKQNYNHNYENGFKTAKKPKVFFEMQQYETKRKNIMCEESEQKSYFLHSHEYESTHMQKNSMQDEIKGINLLQRMNDQIESQNENNQMQNQIVINQKVYCQDGCNIISIQQIENKKWIIYHKFPEQFSQKSTPQLIYPLLQQSDTNKIPEPSKILFLNSTIFYNDITSPKIHSFNLETLQHLSFYVVKPIIDMAILNSTTILGIHNNQIFQFDITKNKRKVLHNYKTIKNLYKISILKQFQAYATVSTDGYVRTYNINNKKKTINKFMMPKGIQKLEISQKFILCGYKNKVSMIVGEDRQDRSVFKSVCQVKAREDFKEIVKGNENINVLQIKDNLVLGIQNTENFESSFVIKNVEKGTMSKVNIKCNPNIKFLTMHEQWLIYGTEGNCYRQKIQINGFN